MRSFRLTLPLLLAAPLAAVALAAMGWMLAAWLLAAASAMIGLTLIFGAKRRVLQRRRRALAARKESQAARRSHLQADALGLRNILDRISLPLLVTSDTGDVSLVNKACAMLLGRDPSTIVGRSLTELFTQSALVDCHDRALAGTPDQIRVDATISAKSRTFDVWAVPLDGAVGVVLTLNDVTDEASAGRLKADFVANASHELRTPLAAIKGSIETLEGGSIEPQMRDRLISIIARNAQRLEDLLADLLELGRLEGRAVPPMPVVVDPRELLQEVASGYELICNRRSLRLEVLVDERLGPLRLDRRLLEVAVSNLIDNATRFAREGTACKVHAKPLAPTSPGQSAGLRIEVTDRGLGIPLGEQTRIFERFYQVDASRAAGTVRAGGTRGTGLGLSIVKHAVQMLEGRVGVESLLNKGSTFWIEIPRCAHHDLSSSGSLKNS